MFDISSRTGNLSRQPQNCCSLVTAREDVCRSLKKIKPHKCPRPDDVPGRLLKECAEQLADAFTNIFNTSQLQPVVI